MTEYDVEVAAATATARSRCTSPDGGEYLVRLVDRRTRMPTTASTTSSPTRCCGSSSTTCGTSRTRRTSAATRSTPSSSATTSSTRTSPRAVVEEIEGLSDPVVMVHDYHLYTLPRARPPRAPDVFLHHFVHIPWTQPDAWRVLPTRIRQELYAGLLANDIIGFHTQLLPAQLPAVLPRADRRRHRLRARAIVVWDGREVWVRAYPLPIDHAATRAGRKTRARRRIRGRAAAGAGATS